MFNFFQGKKIAEQLYQQNQELAVKNKTLSLLEKLYQTSTLTLTPQEMAQAITDNIQKDLNLELAGILRFDKRKDVLESLAFSESERLSKVNTVLKDSTMQKVSQHAFFTKAIASRSLVVTKNIADIWGCVIAEDKLQKIKQDSHIETVLLHPLVIGGEVFGLLTLGFNRDYQALNSFEKESIKNCINPIGLLLYKAYLYQSLQKAYAVKKKANEELEEIAKIKDNFLLTVQHDLRKPLTSVKWFLDMVLAGTLGKQNKKTVEGAKKIQIAIDNSIEEVNSFLDIAQFQMGKTGIVIKPGVELLAIMDQIIAKLKPQAEGKEIYLKLEKPDTLITLQADGVKLKAAVSNIIDNAIKYTPKGGVTVKVQSSLESKSVLIVVQDTGIGIPPDKIQGLFEHMFQRTEEAKRTTTFGKGIGLYLSNQIIKAHKGSVRVESAGEGKGSTFIIELPLA